MLPSSVRIIGLTASKCATQRTAPIALRQFHSTTFNGEEKDTESPQEDAEQSSPAEEAEPVKLSRRRRKFHEWANGEGKKYKEPSQGTTNYIAQTPFPMNPLFKPVLPLSDAVREKIFQQYVSEPEKWTVRKLATEHNLSLARVDAILKLKAQEKQMMGEGIPLQTKFLKGMEKLIGVQHSERNLRETLIEIQPDVNKPKYQIIDEESQFTPEDAAKVLNRRAFADVQKDLLIGESKAKGDKWMVSEKESIEKLPAQNEKESNKRFGFLFVDTSVHGKKSPIVRESDGTLRNAQTSEYAKKMIRY
ncbi:unnamed protein product [Umbelopsis ramanniana]